MKKIVVDIPRIAVEEKNGDVVLTMGAAEAVISQETTMALIYALGSTSPRRARSRQRSKTHAKMGGLSLNAASITAASPI